MSIDPINVKAIFILSHPSDLNFHFGPSNSIEIIQRPFRLAHRIPTIFALGTILTHPTIATNPAFSAMLTWLNRNNFPLLLLLLFLLTATGRTAPNIKAFVLKFNFLLILRNHVFHCWEISFWLPSILTVVITYPFHKILRLSILAYTMLHNLLHLVHGHCWSPMIMFYLRLRQFIYFYIGGKPAKKCISFYFTSLLCTNIFLTHKHFSPLNYIFRKKQKI